MIDIVASSAATLLLDQWSKRLAQQLDGGCISCGPVLQLKYVTNCQRSYRQRSARVLLILLWLLAVISAVVLYRSFDWFHSSWAMCGLGLAFGGAAGNLWDILQHRCVIDFIDLRWWPVFNLADAAIVAGLAMAFAGQI
jgi:signal peptidase II